MGFPGGSDGKESAYSVGDLGSIPGLGRSPGEGHGSPLQYSCLNNPHGQRSLVGYSPWGRKESDMTEQLSMAPYSLTLILKENKRDSIQNNNIVCIEGVVFMRNYFVFLFSPNFNNVVTLP